MHVRHCAATQCGSQGSEAAESRRAPATPLGTRPFIAERKRCRLRVSDRAQIAPSTEKAAAALASSARHVRWEGVNVGREALTWGPG